MPRSGTPLSRRSSATSARPTATSNCCSRTLDLTGDTAGLLRRYASIHGTTAIKQLGRTASHGCVRLHPKNAAVLFNLVLKQGKANTVVWVTE
ncbi:MAG: L,D-transpeptidase [Methyloligellaceae bacterium]